MKALFASICGLLIGIMLASLALAYSPNTLFKIRHFFYKSPTRSLPATKQVIGFLPYWLVEKSQQNYSNYITTLTYFGLTVSSDGTIQRLKNEQEEEPGWTMLKSQELKNRLDIAKKNNQNLSLLVFNGNAESINDLTKDPVPHAKNLINDVEPIMKQYGFSDLNLDLENTTNASDEARMNFSKFARAVRNEMDSRKLGTLTVETAGIDYIKNAAIDPGEVGKIADFIVIMAYDFHYPSSYVSGPVAPIGGGGSTAEFDTSIVLQQAYTKVPREKIILGIPTYGYSWETIGDKPKSATLPGSGITMSNRSAEKLLADCATCSAQLDADAGENYIIYKNPTGTFQQLYFPEKQATLRKVNMAKKDSLGGIAIWALGYENPYMLESLKSYKTSADLTRVLR